MTIDLAPTPLGAAPLQRMNHAGAAVPTTLVNQLNPGDLSFVLAGTSGWPTGGAAGAFLVVIDAGSSSEEKVLCSAQTGGNVGVASGGRGFDGTSQFLHNAGAPVEHVVGAVEIDDANAHIYDTTRDDPSHSKYPLVSGARPFTGLQGFNAGINVTGPTGLTGAVTVTGNETVSGTSAAVSYAAAGLTGAVNASRYAGATAGGAPTTGTFAVGDFVIDRTGAIWICTAAGSPGTWVAPAAPNKSPQGWMAGAIGPSIQTDAPATATTIVQISFPVVAGRKYRVTVTTTGNQITSAASPRSYVVILSGPVTLDNPQNYILFVTSAAASTTLFGQAALMYTATANGTATLAFQGSTTAGAYRFSPNLSQIIVEDAGST